METRLFIKVFLITVMYVYVTFGDAIHYRNISTQYALCGSDECSITASEITARLNHKVDPCNNFYKFACGGWLKNIQLNRPDSYVSMFTEIAEQLMSQLRELLEEPVQKSNSRSFRKAKRIYEQCMINDEFDEMHRKKINYSNILYKYAKWPLLTRHHNWDDKLSSWQHITNDLHKMGFENGLFRVQVVPDIRNFNNNVILITDPMFFYSRDDLLQLNKNKTKEKQMYISLITTIASYLIKEMGGTVEEETLIRRAEEIVNFEIELASLTMKYEDYKNTNTFYIPLTIEQLQEEYDKQHPSYRGEIDWLETIQTVFASEKIAIRPSEKLYVQAYKYLIKLVPLLERTPSPIILNYMIWSSIQWFYSHCISPWEYESDIENNDGEIACINFNLKFAILHEYVKNYVSLDTIYNMEEILANVQYILKEHIKNSTWMDEPTKKMSLEKLTYIKSKFHIPEPFDNDEALIDRYYQDVNVGRNYLDTAINIFLFERKKMMSSLRERTFDNIFEQDIDPTSVQSNYYNPGLRKIVIPVTLLESLTYNRNRLAFMNYGALGVIIGQHFHHAFDENNITFNKDDKASSLLSRLTINDSKITQCFIDQYSKYPFPGLKDIDASVNGVVTLNENIVDSVAVAAAYYAFKGKKAKLFNREWRLRGLEQYSNEQMFFITYAQMLCEKIPQKMLEKRREAVLAPNEIRVRGSLSNFPEFSAAYNCSVGKPMNPKRKCAFW